MVKKLIIPSKTQEFFDTQKKRLRDKGNIVSICFKQSNWKQEQVLIKLRSNEEIKSSRKKLGEKAIASAKTLDYVT